MTYLFQAIKDELIDSSGQVRPFWCGADESTDACKRPVVNFIIGVLDGNAFQRPIVVNCKFLEAAPTGEIMSELMDEALADLELDKEPQKFKVLLSDCASYMTKSGRLMKMNYPSLLHITCLVHAIHRVCEHVRE